MFLIVDVIVAFSSFTTLDYPDVATRLSPPGAVYEGSTINLLCEPISGDIPISYVWTDPNGQVLSPGDTDGNISVSISIYGNYTCTATSDVGMDTATLEIARPGNCAICYLSLLADVLCSRNSDSSHVHAKIMITVMSIESI